MLRHGDGSLKEQSPEVGREERPHRREPEADRGDAAFGHGLAVVYRRAFKAVHPLLQGCLVYAAVALLAVQHGGDFLLCLVAPAGDVERAAHGDAACHAVDGVAPCRGEV